MEHKIQIRTNLLMYLDNFRIGDLLSSCEWPHFSAVLVNRQDLQVVQSELAQILKFPWYESMEGIWNLRDFRMRERIYCLQLAPCCLEPTKLPLWGFSVTYSIPIPKPSNKIRVLLLVKSQTSCQKHLQICNGATGNSTHTRMTGHWGKGNILILCRLSVE